ncbi:MAG: class I SAM-dependent methyltransferase [archaeon]
MEKMDAGKLFDNRVEDYDSFVNSTVIGYENVLDLIKQLTKIIVKTDSPKVLDLGAGTGNSSMAILHACPKASIIGYDLSKKMVEKTNERFSKFDYKGVCDNVLNIDFDNEFDLIVSSIVLHHLNDKEKQEVYKKIFKALKGKGVFILGDLMLAEDNSINSFLKEQWENHIVYKRGEEYKNKIFSLEDKHHQYASLNNNLKFLKTTGFKTDVIYRKLNTAVILCYK